MLYKKAYASKFILPIREVQVIFFKSRHAYAVTHIKIPRISGENRSICGFHLGKSELAETPEIIADLCVKCLKGQYNYFEQDLPFDTSLWVDYFNDITKLEDTPRIDKFGFDVADFIERQLDYELQSIRIQNEIKRCNHVHLVYLMRYNNLLTLECHNCQQEIGSQYCSCDDPMTIDFVDTTEDGIETGRDAFCMNCNGYLVRDVDKFL